jgi:hypothetical protein
MSSEAAGTEISRRVIASLKFHRMDPAVNRLFALGSRLWARLAIIALGTGFVLLGADNLDLGPVEARLGLAARESFGPMGQAFGCWAPDLWPAQVLPSKMLALFEQAWETSSGSVRWPAAIAGFIVGLILIRGMARVQGTRASLFLGLCWFGSIGLIDRSAGAGVDLIVGLGTIVAINRIMSRGPDLVAGLWASWAFLAGGWPPLAVIFIAAVILAKNSGGLTARLVLPPLVVAVAWSAWAIARSSAEAWAAALALPFTQKPSWALALAVVALGLPWSPFATLAASAGARRHWKPECHLWVIRWLQVALACLIAGTLVPGMSSAARMVCLAGVAVAAAASLESAWCQSLPRAAKRGFFSWFTIITMLWLIGSIYWGFVWCVAMPYYRAMGVVTAFLIAGVGLLAYSALASGNVRRGMIAIIIVSIGIKLAHWGYYVPEWNYRFSQGPWARAIAQWVPRRWTLYTIHDWPPDLAFFMKRPVRQLRSPRFLEYQPGPDSKFVLLLPSERENWPESALPIETVARFHDESGGERVLARSPGDVPPPLGPYPFRVSPAPPHVSSRTHDEGKTMR